MKSTLLKAADVSGLTFLMPVIRFAAGDERPKQLREMGRMILVPLIAVGVFLAAWMIISPLVKTKSGELPPPSMTADAAGDIWRIHKQEYGKEEAFLTASPEERDAWIERVEARLGELDSADAKVGQVVATRREESAAANAATLAPLIARRDELKATTRGAARTREAKLDAFGRGLSADDTAGRSKLLAMLRAHEAQKDLDGEAVRELDDEIREKSGRKSRALKAALAMQTDIAEEKRYLQALKGSLTRSKQSQIDDAVGRLDETKSAYLAATGPDVLAAAKKVVAAQENVVRKQELGFAKSYTLPMQIWRSILCVFAGFLLGVSIAIPIGVLCGLSPTFMSAMTPFIALFKPVSPIVWVLIALIVVSGALPDPDTHPLMVFLADLPLIGWMKINPAFIASAFTVALCSLWPTMTNTALGVASISEDHLNVARVLRLSFFERLVKIVIPSALPLIFAGMRISLGVGWMVLIAAELLSTSEGIGKFVADQWQNGSPDSFAKMIVVVFVVGAIGLLLDRIMIVLQRAVSFDGAPAAV